MDLTTAREIADQTLNGDERNHVEQELWDARDAIDRAVGTWEQEKVDYARMSALMGRIGREYHPGQKYL